MKKRILNDFFTESRVGLDISRRRALQMMAFSRLVSTKNTTTNFLRYGIDHSQLRPNSRKTRMSGVWKLHDVIRQLLFKILRTTTSKGKT